MLSKQQQNNTGWYKSNNAASNSSNLVYTEAGVIFFDFSCTFSPTDDLSDLELR